MKGTIIKRSENSYRIKVSLGKDLTTGKYKAYFETVKGTKADSQRRLRELLTQLDKGIFIKPTKETLANYLNSWLKDYAKPNCAPRTFESYDMIVKLHLIPALGLIPLLSLQPQDIQKYYAKALDSGRRDGRGGLSALTVRKHHRVLFEALRYGVKHEMIARNVAEAVDPPRAQAKEMQIWNANEIERFLEKAKSTPYYALFHLNLFSGLRRSEILGLKWADIDFMFCQLSVNRALHQLKDGRYVFRPPKTAKGKRKVSLTPLSLEVMQEYYEEQKQLCDTLGIPYSDERLVFCHVEDGKPLRPNTITRAWASIGEKAGLKHIRLHDCRHSHASLLLKQGIHPKIVSERLGHSSVQITLDTYSHVTCK
jgi:integrase